MEFKTTRTMPGFVGVEADAMEGLRKSVDGSQPLMSVIYLLEIVEQMANALDATQERLEVLESSIEAAKNKQATKTTTAKRATAAKKTVEVDVEDGPSEES